MNQSSKDFKMYFYSFVTFSNSCSLLKVKTNDLFNRQNDVFFIFILLLIVRGKKNAHFQYKVYLSMNTCSKFQ